MKSKLVFIALTLLISFTTSAQDKKYKVHTVAFYNLENLFDTIPNPEIYDTEFTPNGARGWGKQKYEKKLANLSKAISQIGTDENPNMPTILGVSEIENKGVLEDLIKTPDLAKANYGIVHYNSPDRRGIDVGLLYQKDHFKPTSQASIPLYIYDKSDKKYKDANDGKGKRIYTRDQLVVTGLLDGEEVSFLVSHWPSRSGGEKKSSPNREAAAALNKKIIDSLYNINPNAKIITMGDFNDGPYNKSVKDVLDAKGKREDVKSNGLFNPMFKMSQDGLGTLAYRDAWDVFDQMIVSEPLLDKDYSSYRFWKAKIFNKPFLIQQSGQYKGYPLRNQTSGEPGFSDHFPVYLLLVKEM
nr:endonuclease/exonuclease/phosphatase family protein [uncultured Flavobacterium sp.]